jgi:hypothetical protein
MGKMSKPNYYIVRFHDYDLQASLKTDDIDRLHNTVFNGLLKIYRNNVHALKFIRVDEKLPGPDLMYRKESIFVVKTEKDYRPAMKKTLYENIKAFDQMIIGQKRDSEPKAQLITEDMLSFHKLTEL